MKTPTPTPVVEHRTIAPRDVNEPRTEGGGRAPLERLHRFFDRMHVGGFFGKITVTMQNGRVQDVKIEQSKKLDEL